MKRNETDKLFENLPACAADFIKLVIKKMRYRKKVRREVLAELAAHFEDELSGCKTEDEKEQKAQQLINEFGDVKLLAVLLRRAKKRCRPLWRTVVARGFQTACVLILCLIVYIAWFLTGKPNVTVNYITELNRIVRPVADESQNAASFYHKAVKSIENIFENMSEDMRELLGKRPREFTDDDAKRVGKWLDDNKETLDLIIKGSQKPYYWEQYGTTNDTGEMLSILMPNLSSFRRLAYALRSRAWVNAEKGRYEDAFSDLICCYKFGQHLRGDKTLIEQLVGIAIEASSVHTIRYILERHQLDSSKLKTLQINLENAISEEKFTVSFKAEKLCMRDELQRCFTAGENGHLIPKRITMLKSLKPGPRPQNYLEEFLYVFSDLDILKKVTYMIFLHPNRQETLEAANYLYDYYERLSEKSAAQVNAEADEIDKIVEKLFEENLFMAILSPALRRVIDISHRLPADLNSIFAIVAILRYKQDKGDYPDTLEEMVTSGYLKQLPMDSFSDKPLVYKKTAEGFLLYSVGMNFKDDGGVLAKNKKGETKLWANEGDAVFWPVMGK